MDVKSLITGLSVGVAGFVVLTEVKKAISKPSASSVKNPSPGKRKYLIGGNWKCNLTLQKVAALVKSLNSAGPIPDNVDVVVGVPMPYLSLVRSTLRSDIEVAGQDSCVKTFGANTGETAATMLTEVGCTWVILGHSERRAGFNGHAQELRQGESNETVATKTKLAVDAGLKVMVCVGEHKKERQDGVTMKIVGEQLTAVKSALTTADWANVSIAYEPCWAIGTGLAATPEMAQETHSEIRAWVAKNVSADVAEKVRIQYGGSMKAANAKALLCQPDIDGGLIGGASLKPEFFDCVNGVPGM